MLGFIIISKNVVSVLFCRVCPEGTPEGFISKRVMEMMPVLA